MTGAGNIARLHKKEVIVSATLIPQDCKTQRTDVGVTVNEDLNCDSFCCLLDSCYCASIHSTSGSEAVLWDDLFLAIAFCCLSIALAVFYTVSIDKMYLTLAVQYGETAGITLPQDIIQITFDYQKWIQVTTVMLWLAIMSVKFSFLALFKNLVKGILPLSRYWCVVTILNIGILGYGSVVTHISCPYYYTLKNCEHKQFNISRINGCANLFSSYMFDPVWPETSVSISFYTPSIGSVGRRFE